MRGKKMNADDTIVIAILSHDFSKFTSNFQIRKLICLKLQGKKVFVNLEKKKKNTLKN